MSESEEEELKKRIKKIQDQLALLLTAMFACVIFLCYMIYLKYNIHQWPWWLP